MEDFDLGTGLETVASRAYRELHGRILRRELKPGEALRQNRLSKELGVGTNPLREAMVRLECDGLIEIVPQWGGRVRIWTKRDLRDFYEYRAAIESRIARLCAQRGSDQEFQELTELGKEIERTLDSSKPQQIENLTLDFEFHRHVARFARSRLLLEQFNRMDVLHQLIHSWDLLDTAKFKEKDLHNWEDHPRLAQALASRDPDRAEHSMRLHLEPWMVFLRD